MTLLFCGVDLIGFVIVSLCPLVMTITLYHGYLGESVKVKEVFSGVRKYTMRWICIFLLILLLVIVMAALRFTILNTINFLFCILVLNILPVFFLNFLITYVELEMIRNNSGIKEAIQHGAEVWTIRQDIKIMTALLYTLIQIIIAMLIVGAQKGFSVLTFNSITYHEYASFVSPLVPSLLLNIFCALLAPVFDALLISAYFGDLQKSSRIISSPIYIEASVKEAKVYVNRIRPSNR